MFVFFESPKYRLFRARIVGYEEFPRSSFGKIQILEENDDFDIDKSIDKQLISPSDPDIDFTGMIMIMFFSSKGYIFHLLEARKIFS